MIYFLITLGLLVYLLIGMSIRAAIMCKHAGKYGVSYIISSDADAIMFCWPFWLAFRIVVLPIGAIFALSNRLYKLCYRFKTGKDPIYY
jgi:hypothetical protein